MYNMLYINVINILHESTIIYTMLQIYMYSVYYMSYVL